MVELQTVWGWQPALYLFLGGLGAATFLVAALVRLITRSHHKVVCIGMWSATAFLIVGLLLLVSEISAPLRAVMMWRSFSNIGSSWMAVGAWLLFAGIVVFGLASVCSTPALCRIVRLSEDAARKAVTAFSIPGALFALGIMAYTGILLMSAPGVPLWNTVLLPCLFTVSALDTGVAFIALLMAALDVQAHSVRFRLEEATMALVLVEVAVLVLFVSFSLGGGDPLFSTLEPGWGDTAATSVGLWLNGRLAVAFWVLFVAVGLVLPFVAALYSTVLENPKGERIVSVAGGVGVLVGGCTLRFITLLAGLHVNIVLDAVSAL